MEGGQCQQAELWEGRRVEPDIGAVGLRRLMNLARVQAANAYSSRSNLLPATRVVSSACPADRRCQHLLASSCQRGIAFVLLERGQ